MRQVILIGLSVVALGGCVSSQEREAKAAVQASTNACEAQTFKTAVAKIRCYNAALEPRMAAAGRDGDLIRVGLAKGMVLAERLDRRQINQAEFNLEMAQTIASIESVRQQRDANAAAIEYQQMQQLSQQLAQTGQQFQQHGQQISQSASQFTPPQVMPITPYGGSTIKCINAGIYTNCRY